MAGICNTLKNEKKYIKHALEHENSTSKIHEAVKNIKQMTSKEKLNLETKEWLTMIEKQQSEIITKSFENTFYNSNIVAVKYSNPDHNTSHIIQNKKTVWNLKDNNSPGID